MSKLVMTEDQVWNYYLNRNMWAKDVDFEHLKDELRKQGTTILEQRARYAAEDGEYIVFIESQIDDETVIVFPDSSRKTVKTSELKEY